MDRYVLVCNIEGEALKFHDKITNEVCYKFNKKRQKLPAHFTLKAPFETDKISEMTETLYKFASERVKTPIKILGLGSFGRDVVFMKVNVSEEGKRIYNELIDELTKIPWIEFKINEGKNKIIHCTIVSKRIQDRFEEIWQYVNQYKCNFQAYFDNLSLYKWEDNTWILYKRIEFKDV